MFGSLRFDKDARCSYLSDNDEFQPVKKKAKAEKVKGATAQLPPKADAAGVGAGAAAASGGEVVPQQQQQQSL